MSGAAISVLITTLMLAFAPLNLYLYVRDTLHIGCDPANEEIYCDPISTILPSYAWLFVQLGVVTTVVFTVVAAITPASQREALSKDLRFTAALLMSLTLIPVAAYTTSYFGTPLATASATSVAVYALSIAGLYVSLGRRPRWFSALASAFAVAAIVFTVLSYGLLFIVAGILAAYPLSALIALVLPARREAATRAIPAL
jgi:hypothetical protein